MRKTKAKNLTGHQGIYTEEKRHLYGNNPTPNKKADGAGNAETLDAFPLKLGM